MTDNEIIKALECCSNDDDDSGCRNCPLGDKYPYCDDVLDGRTIDLINRQKAEIEALIAGQETLQKYIVTAKADAIKEFADCVKKHQEMLFNEIYSSFGFAEAIDNLVDEMVGDNNG